MKVLIVHNYYQQAGGERFAVKAQETLLRQAGDEVILYTKDNADIHQYDAIEKLQTLPDTIFSRKTYREVLALVEQEQPDIAHIHNVFPLISPAVYQALHDARLPTVQTIHNFRLMCPNGLFFTKGQLCERCKQGNMLSAIRYRCHRDSYLSSTLYALTIMLHRQMNTFNLVDRFIALTEFSAQQLVESGLIHRGKVTVLGNYLPDPLPEPGHWEARDPYILFLGRLVPEKGINVLLEAMRELPTVRLKILGEGSELVSLKERARRLKLSQVEFLGYVAGEAKWDLLRRASATVVPSVWYEHFPFAVLESLAVGTPVIASNLGSFPHILTDQKNALLFEPANPQDLAEKVRELFTREEQMSAMRRDARQLVEEQFRASVHYEVLTGIYNQLIAQGKRV